MDFTAILNTVVEAVKGIDWGKVFETVKGIAQTGLVNIAIITTIAAILTIFATSTTLFSASSFFHFKFFNGNIIFSLTVI